MSELRYRSNDSTALWTPSIPQQPAIAFIYELSMEKGPIIQSSRLTSTELRLPGLEDGKTYILDMWEECDGQWESEPSRLSFKGSNSSSELHVRAAGTIQNQGQAGVLLVLKTIICQDRLEQLCFYFVNAFRATVGFENSSHNDCALVTS